MPSKEQLINALTNEYTHLCHDDFDPAVDPTPEEYRNHLEYLTVEELIEEISISNEYTLDDYMEVYGS